MERQTVSSLYEDAIQYDVPYLANFIYFAITKGKITMEDDASKLDDITLTEQEQMEFDEMRSRNTLNLRPNQLYAIKRSAEQYVFYFAQNAGEARKLHHQLYGEWVSKLTNAHNQMMDKSLYFPETNETKTFRELLHDTWEFPCRVCELGTGGTGSSSQFLGQGTCPSVPNTTTDLEPIKPTAHYKIAFPKL
ncbi:hypothetical protein ACQKMN_13055 [Ureibacillus composti]